jgi:fructose-1-phosphate kinase PfkB-like protein
MALEDEKIEVEFEKKQKSTRSNIKISEKT